MKLPRKISWYLTAFLLDRKQRGYMDRGTKAVKERMARSVAEKAVNGDPKRLMRFLNHNYAKNSIKAIFSDVEALWSYLVDTGVVDGPNPYRAFRRKNSRNGTFSGRDMPKKVGVTYKEAWKKCLKIEHDGVRIRALELLATGLRFGDAQRATGSNCIQKGGQSKPINGLAPGQVIREFPYSYEWFRRELKRETGLSPHDFRRLVAKHLYEGLKLHPIQIQQWLGHKSLETTMKYIDAAELEQITLALGEIA